MDKRHLRLVLLFAAICLFICSVITVLALTKRQNAPRFVPAPTASRTHTQGMSTPSPTPTPKSAHGDIGISDNLGHLPAAERNKRLSVMRQAGVQWLRKDIEWRGAEPEQGQYKWSQHDPTIASIRAHGIEPLLILGYAPNWAAAEGQPYCDTIRCSPAADKVQAFAKFAGATAKHYCGAPYNVRAYEIWNEPNLHKYWPSPDPALYVRYLRAAFKAIKAAGCNATVMLGSTGDSTCTSCFTPGEFLNGVYAAGGKPFFDYVGSHPYVQGVPDPHTWRPLALHEIMMQYGDGHKQIWATEFAYSSNIGTQLQAQQMQAAVTVFRSYPWSGPLFWFSLQDTPGGEPFGLVDQLGKPKPALATLGKLAQTG